LPVGSEELGIFEGSPYDESRSHEQPSTKSRQTIYGGGIMGAKMRAGLKRPAAFDLSGLWLAGTQRKPLVVKSCTEGRQQGEVGTAVAKPEIETSCCAEKRHQDERTT